ncbi:MAG: hypothetical protein AAGI54_04175 [Planctomycetota bacterium]
MDTDCPRCGCNLTHAVTRASVFEGKAVDETRRVCDACGYGFRVGGWKRPASKAIAGGHADRGVTFPVLRCPKCNAKRPSTTSSPKALPGEHRERQHKCRRCGHTFQSYEAPD